MTLNKSIERFVDLKACNSLYNECGFFGLTINNVITSTGRTERTLYNWSKNDRDMLLIVLIGCHKLSKK